MIWVLDGPVTPLLEQVINKWKDKLSIHIVCLLKNFGLGRALNEGLKVCDTEWIFHMDTDDVCAPDYIFCLANNKNKIILNIWIIVYE